VALTIAGSDSGAGAGVAADLKTFEAHGVWGAMAVTAVTAQNTAGVQQVSVLDPQLVALQIESVAGDLGVDAAKTGMLGNAAVVKAVVAALRRHGIGPLVVDPVMASGHGEALLDQEGVAALCAELLPLATVVTPNLIEAAVLAGRPVQDRQAMVDAAEAIAAFGPAVVMVTGGHLADGPGSPDLVWLAGEQEWLEAPRIDAGPVHGTGCVLSAAITAALARGESPGDACVAAKAFVTAAIEASTAIGRGSRPVDPGWARGAPPA
jgi:hydroxymethylpyrimidine/phosphomethylpyrimidine kinase